MKNVTLNNFSASVQRLNIILSFLPLGSRGRKTVSHVLLILCLTTCVLTSFQAHAQTVYNCIDTSICSESVLIWNGNMYTNEGIYTDTFTAANASDSIVTLKLNYTYPANAIVDSALNQIGQDIDGTSFREFSGTAVATNAAGNIAAIGAYRKNSVTGQVRVFQEVNGNWVALGLPIDGIAVNDFLGWSVSLNATGNIMAIGASQNATASNGYVQIYQYTAGTWVQLGSTIIGETAGDYFGYSVSLNASGNIVAIGATDNDDNGSSAGHVRIYENIGGTWSQVGADIDGEAAVDFSGESVSLNATGNIVAIGAPSNDDNGFNAGHVRIYENLGGTWMQVGADIDGAAAGDEAGRSVSLNAVGNVVAIGAKGNDDGGTDAGHVRIYENISGVWMQVGADIDGEAAGDNSGWSVALNATGNIVAIGARDNDDGGTDAGHVRIYKNIGGVWQQILTDIDGEAADDQSGISVALNAQGNRVVIGAYLNSGGGSRAGHVRIYEIKEAVVGAKVFTDTIVTCDSHTWINGVTYNCNNTTAVDTLMAANGCDSIVNLHLTLTYPANAIVDSALNQVGQDIDGTSTTEYSGAAVSTNAAGNMVAIGAYGKSSFTGQVRVFQEVNGNWVALGLPIDGIAVNDFLGNSVSLNATGNIMAIGATQNGTASNGYVQIYQYTAGTWVQLGSTIIGETSGDDFGWSVALNASGNMVAIGALENDNVNGANAGHVRIYENISGTWTQVGADIDGEAASDNSGNSVALNAAGNIVAIGAYLNDDGGNNAGHVRIYENIGGTWTQVGADIDGAAAGDRTGFSVALNAAGNIVALGAKDNDDGGTDAGHVRIYENLGGTWMQVGADIDGAAAGDNSGWSVALNAAGNMLAIGAHRNDNANGIGSGHVRIYKNIGGAWQQILTDIDGEAAFDNSGISVALNAHGNRVVIGAYRNDDGDLDAGHVRIYEIKEAVVGAKVFTDTIVTCDSHTWINGVTYNCNNTTAVDTFMAANGCDSIVNLHLTLTYSANAIVDSALNQIGQDIDGTSFREFSGLAVTTNAAGNIVAIGAFGKNTRTGQVRVFQEVNGNWVALGLPIDGIAVNDFLGYSVSLNATGNIMAIGAPQNGTTSNGYVQIYQYTAGTWVQVGSTIIGETSGDDFGRSVALNASGNMVAIGALENDDGGTDAGHVRIYENIGGTWMQVGADIDGEAASDLSGNSVSLNAAGNVVAIGASANDDNGSNAGHVRIYQYNGSSWIQVGADIDGAAAGDFSGISVALNAAGNIVAIGAESNDNANGTDAGHVRIYENISGTWTQVGADIDGEAAGDNSGWSVSLNVAGNIVAIGAPSNDNLNGTDAGHVRIYKNIGGVWQQILTDIDGEAADDQSGISVALNAQGNRVVIGAYLNNNANGGNAGHVRIYEIKVSKISDTVFVDSIVACDTYTWTNGMTYTTSNNTATDTFMAANGCDSIVNLHLTLTYSANAIVDSALNQIGQDIDGTSTTEYSGAAVSTNAAGNIVAIGAYGKNSLTGQVRVFQEVNGNWVALGLAIDGIAVNDFLGNSVSLNATGNMMAIGAPQNGTASNGYVQIYQYTAGAWVQVGSTIIGETSGDDFGRSVALNASGNMVAIGALENDDGGTDAGHVRIYENNTGVWTQVGFDIDGAAAFDNSGRSVSLNAAGNIVAIGATNNDDGGNNAGHVRIYQYNGSSWTQVGADIDGAAAGDRTGFSVALNAAGNIVAIGAKDNDDGGTDAGHVRIYENLGGTWMQVGADIDGAAAGDNSGWSVSLNAAGNLLAIGAGLNNNANGTDAGHVRIYKNIGGAWQQILTDIDGEAADDQSGVSVALNAQGNRVVIGAYLNSDAGFYAGHVRIYEIKEAVVGAKVFTDTIVTCDSHTWVNGVTYNCNNTTAVDTLMAANGCDSIVNLHLTLTYSANAIVDSALNQIGQDIDGTSFREFSGLAVTTNAAGNIVAIGAFGKNTRTGQVRVFQEVNGNWVALGLPIDGIAVNDFLGYSVSLNATGNIMAIGAPQNGTTSNGYVQIYQYTAGTWVQVGSTIIGETSGDDFGRSVALNASGNMVAIGALENDDGGTDAGHVRIYENIGGTWMQVGADIDGEAASDLSGNSVSLNAAGNVVAIGASANDDNGSNAGHVRIYQYNGSSWIQVGADIDGAAAGDFSGISVALNAAGNIVAIGAESNDNANGTDAGHVRIYENISGTWTQVGADIDGEAAGDNSGWSVSLNVAGNIVAIGAPSNDNLNGTDAGHVRIYKNIGGVWQQILTDIDGEAADDQSGISVALNAQGNRVVIGAYLNNNANGGNAGHVRIYEIKVSKISDTVFVDSIVACDTYTWTNGMTYTTSNNTATDTFMAANGCDSVVTLNLTINNSNTNTDVIVACDTYTWTDGMIYTTSTSTPTDTFMNADGCDSVVRLNLTINNSNTSTDVIVACDTYTWTDGMTYTASNSTATDTFTNAAGCDSIVTLNLTILTSTSSIQTVTACDSYTWTDGMTYTTSTSTPTDTFVNAVGCDSIVTLNLTILTSTSSIQTVTACDSYTWTDGMTYTASNSTATDTFINAAGCDSVVTLNLTINNSNTSTDVITACDTYTWTDGNTYTASNSTATDTFTNAAGCDSVVTLNLTINYATTGVDAQSICAGDSLLWNGTYYNATGLYTATLPAANTCDSVITLTLLVNQHTSSMDNQSICNGDSLLWNETYYNATGMYNFTTTNANGCDSVITLMLTVNAELNLVYNEDLCAGDTLMFRGGNTWGGKILTGSGSFMQTVPGGIACDTVITININQLNTTASADAQTICAGDSLWWNGAYYNAAGVYQTTLTGSNTCDSVVTLTLGVNQPTSSTSNQSICAGDSILWNGTYQSATGIYQVTLVNANGCDSIATLNLTVTPSLAGVDAQTICDGDNLLWNGNNYSVAGMYQTTLTAANGCDSVVTLTLTVNPNVTGADAQTICDGDSLLWNGAFYNSAGAYQTTLTAANGCDSVVTLTLTVNPNVTGADAQTICDGDSLLWNGNTYVVAGMYQTLLTAASGCDSTVTLTLIVNQNAMAGVVDTTFCDTLGGINILGQSITTTGSTTIALPNMAINGCDSSVTVNATVITCIPIVNDTLRLSVTVTDSLISICPTGDDLLKGIDSFAIVDCGTGIPFGNWMMDSTGCLIYMAGSLPGNEVDTFCGYAFDEDGAFDLTVMIISVMLPPCDSFAAPNAIPNMVMCGTGTTILTPMGGGDSFNIVSGYNFYADSSLTQLLAGNVNQFDPLTTPGNTDSIYITAKSDSCESEAILVVIDVKIQPVLAVVNDSLWCKNLAVNLPLQLINPAVTAGAGTGSYLWYNDNGGMPDLMAGPIVGQTATQAGTYWVVYNENGCTAQTSFDIDTIVCNTVDLSLIAFDAVAENCEVTLNWSTASEVNVNFFVIERSTDGINFELVGRVDAASNSNTMQYYNWVDEDPAVGELYYRLTEVEDDGSKNVLRIIATNSNCYVNNDLIVYPNPTVNSLNIVYASDAAGTTTIEILDELGRVVLTTERPLIIGDNNHAIAVGTLPNAMYMVRLIENNKRLVGYEKFVKVEN